LEETGADSMKTKKHLACSIFMWCIILIYSNVVFANSGIYHYSNDFKEDIQQNPIDRDYQIEFKAVSTTIGYDSLEGKYIGLWDRELNVIYNKLLARLTEQQKDVLIDSQVAWLNWHSQETKFVDMTWLADRKLGSQGAIQELKAQKYRLRDRTLELMEYYCLLGGNVEFEYR